MLISPRILQRKSHVCTVHLTNAKNTINNKLWLNAFLKSTPTQMIQFINFRVRTFHHVKIKKP